MPLDSPEPLLHVPLITRFAAQHRHGGLLRAGRGDNGKRLVRNGLSFIMIPTDHIIVNQA